MQDIQGWRLLESMVQLLEPLMTLTNAFGASNITSSKVSGKQNSCLFYLKHATVGCTVDYKGNQRYTAIA